MLTLIVIIVGLVLALLTGLVVFRYRDAIRREMRFQYYAYRLWWYGHRTFTKDGLERHYKEMEIRRKKLDEAERKWRKRHGCDE